MSRASNAAPNDSLDETVARLVNNGNMVTDPRSGSAKPRLNLYAALTGLLVPPACSVSVNTSNVDFGNSVTFTIAGSSLPAGSTAYWYGTKNGVDDVTAQFAGPAPGAYSFTNSAGSEGSYVRRAQIRNSLGTAICTTNDANVQFNLPPPTCSLSASTGYAPIGGGFSLTVAATNVPVGVEGYWYGTKNSVTDAVGQAAGGVPRTFGYTNLAGYSGVYSRYMEIRSGASVVCTTNSVNITLQ